MYSFYDWCIDNNKEKYLELWDKDNNIKSPNNISHRSHEAFYFKCERRLHKNYKKVINNLINSKDCVCPECHSLYQWLIDNNRYDLINICEDINEIKKISRTSSTKVNFNVNGIIYSIPSAYIISGKTDPIKKYYNSLGYYLLNNFGEDSINKYWSNKNDVSPFYVNRGSGKKYWIKCQEKDYHDDYQIQICNFTGKSQNRCPMCASKIIHPRDSFAQFNIDRFGNNWLDEYWCDDNILDPFAISAHKNSPNVHIKCMKISYHDFWTSPNNYSSRTPAPCPYCKRRLLHEKDSLAGQLPEIVNIWSDKNDKSPYEYALTSHKKVYLKCENGLHEDYLRTISDYTFKGFKTCPKCVAPSPVHSSYQKKTEKYLSDLNYYVLHEYNCNLLPINPRTGYPLPLDNEIPSLRLIIEVNGKQHYELSGWYELAANKNSTTPEEEFEYVKWKDIFKKEYVLNNGYYYLELPYYTFDNDEYKTLINKKILEIKNQESVSTAGNL